MAQDKIYIVTTEDHVIKYITSKLVVEGNILRLNGFNIVNDGVVIHELDRLPLNLTVEEDCFNGTDFFKNPNFKDNSEVYILRQKLKETEDKLSLMQDALDEFILGGGL